MKLKVYKLAAMALTCLMVICANTFAQQSSSPSTSSAPAAPAAPLIITGTYNYTLPPAINYSLSNTLSGNLAPLVKLDGQYLAVGVAMQDTIYHKKMQKLQEQMTELRKQMSDLRNDEIKKNSAERSKQTAERMATQSKFFSESFKKFDQTFNEKFTAIDGRINRGFNSDKNEDLDKKVASGDYKLKSKAYTKTYNIDGNNKININNHYGKVTVNTWNKNEVKVDVEIKAYANIDDDAQKLLDQVKITDSKDNAGVSFATVIGDENHKNNFWGTWSSNGKTTIRKTIINYTVYMPAKNALTLSNSYGAIVLPELSGKVMVKNSYGSLTSKGFTNSNNAVDVRYGSADIDSFGGGDLNISYGSLNLPLADKLNATIKYSPAKIGKLSTSGVIDLHYGDGLQIGNLDKNLKTLSVSANYAPVKLTLLNNNNADFDVTVHYGGFTYNNGVSVTSKSPDDSNGRWSSTQTYKGHIGKGNPDKLIIIKTNYSSVKFDQ